MADARPDGTDRIAAVGGYSPDAHRGAARDGPALFGPHRLAQVSKNFTLEAQTLPVRILFKSDSFR